MKKALSVIRQGFAVDSSATRSVHDAPTQTLLTSERARRGAKYAGAKATFQLLPCRDAAMKSDHAAMDAIGRFKVRKINEPNAFPDLRNVSQTF